MHILIKNGKNSTYNFRPWLKSHGFTYKEEDIWEAEIDEKQIPKIQKFCSYNHLNFNIDNEFSKRGISYRKDFFNNNKPMFFNKYYVCAYCGKWLTKEKVTVDHIIPVAQAKKRLKLQKRLEKEGYTSINDTRNLVAACSSCNSSKGQKMDYRVHIAKLGKKKWFNIIRYILKLIILIIGIVLTIGVINNFIAPSQPQDFF